MTGKFSKGKSLLTTKATKASNNKVLMTMAPHSGRVRFTSSMHKNKTNVTAT